MNSKLEQKLIDALVKRDFLSYASIVSECYGKGKVLVHESDSLGNMLCSNLLTADVLEFSGEEMVDAEKYFVYKLTAGGSASAMELEK
jgi:hypothetical protein